MGFWDDVRISNYLNGLIWASTSCISGWLMCFVAMNNFGSLIRFWVPVVFLGILSLCKVGLGGWATAWSLVSSRATALASRLALFLTVFAAILTMYWLWMFYNTFSFIYGKKPEGKENLPENTVCMYHHVAAFLAFVQVLVDSAMSFYAFLYWRSKSGSSSSESQSSSSSWYGSTA
mmetsp:Transcript_89986/g.155870  ORF Transcript_89986/g.155870 Transcript_89986/m.155870 type:complete len:176 (+) Transcript_89986:103-630(+)